MVLLLAHDRSSLNLAHPGTADGGCRKGMSAVERQPVARAVLRAAEATQQFILGFLALVHAVTELVRVQADPRVSAVVETRTREAVTAVLVLASRAVVDTVTAEEDGQAVTAFWSRKR